MARKSTLMLAVTLLASPLAFSQSVLIPGTAIGDIKTGNDFFVRWKPGTSEDAIERYHQHYGLKVLWRSSLVPGLERVAPQVEDRALSESAVRELGTYEEVLYAEPNYRVKRDMNPVILPEDIECNYSGDLGLAAPNDPMYKQQWGLNGSNGINVEKAWEVTKGSKSVTVAVIDTGVDQTHVELKGRCAKPYDFIEKNTNVSDPHGHGTHCAGVVGAAVNNSKGIAGINHDLTIMPLRIIPANGDEEDADIIASYEYAAKEGAKVASCSFAKAQSSQAVGDTMVAASQKGLFIVVAAGNDSKDISKSPMYPASFKVPDMIVIAAIGSGGRIASFSNFGPIVHIAAPGENIQSTVPNNGYQSMSGTSMAAPHVAGVAGLMYAVNPNLTPAKAKEILMKSVKKLSNLNNKVTTGGTLDASAAVNAAKSMMY